ncbi:putative sulfate/molybdate transporter [Maritimibacter sp. 55A14]|uniref:putative sulfate/molybdate transporter n=1 Tax=Maritimibacter sp. 55A14 TaxID=2174844 RepID=UPI00130493DF|nr:putative sulfate/molybdate transporter [Maritimibacter sp. 55A14]
MWLRRAISEISGACGDLGTWLPYVVAAVGGGLLAPAPVFLGFAAGYLLVALVYRVPVAVQPMKALGAVILAGGLSAAETAWAGAVIGAVLLALAASPALNRAARAIPQSVVAGLQAGLGLILGMAAAGMIAADWLLALPALAVLGLALVFPRGPWALLAVGGAVLLGPVLGGSPDLPEIVQKTGPVAGAAVLSGVLAQLPLTLVNAVVVAAAVARSLFPGEAARISERRLAATSGALNLLLAPLGALPMCHGAGGIAAHHRFGARGTGAPLILAACCGGAALAGADAVRWLAAIPLPVVGALLAYAAADLVLGRRIFDARPDCRPVIAATALATAAIGPLAGLVAGLAAEALRTRLRQGSRSRR